MENTVIYNSDLHFEHRTWASELYFWKDEMMTFKNRLQSLIQRNTDMDMLKQIEHYQNEFLIHESKIDELLEYIDEHETRIAGQSISGEDAMDRILVEKHLEIRDKLNTERELYYDLKKEFFNFLTRYLI